MPNKPLTEWSLQGQVVLAVGGYPQIVDEEAEPAEALAKVGRRWGVLAGLAAESL